MAQARLQPLPLLLSGYVPKQQMLTHKPRAVSVAPLAAGPVTAVLQVCCTLGLDARVGTAWAAAGITTAFLASLRVALGDVPTFLK